MRCGTLSAMGWSARARALLLASTPVLVGTAATSLGACSFLLDFPKEGGAGGSAGTGGAGGAPGPTCDAFAKAPTLAQTLWNGTIASPVAGDQIVTRGLARDPTNNAIYAYGRTRDGLTGLMNAPSPAGSGTSELFLVSIPPNGAPTLAMSAQSCDAANEPAVAGRMTVFHSDGRQIVSGAIGENAAGATTWSLSTSGNDCGTPQALMVSGEQFSLAGVPFFALVAGATLTPNLANNADGYALDVDDTASPDGMVGNIAAIGVASGIPFGTNADPFASTFFLQRSTETTMDETFILPDLFQNDHSIAGAANGDDPYPQEAAIAVDDDGTAWFGGGACKDSKSCTDEGAFIGTLGRSGVPKVLISRPGATSTVTAIDIADHVVVVGGRTEGSLQLLGAQLPPATGVDAFVIAIDAKTQMPIWTYPGATATPGFQTDAWESVVDLSALGTRSCGAVYVAGCSVPSGAPNPNCALPTKGQHGFIAKLDLGTGKEIWVNEILVANPATDLFLPTALRAVGDDVLLAATSLGSQTVAGGAIDSPGTMSTFVLRLTK